jgi:hypothetical protein
MIFAVWIQSKLVCNRVPNLLAHLGFANTWCILCPIAWSFLGGNAMSLLTSNHQGAEGTSIAGLLYPVAQTVVPTKRTTNFGSHETAERRSNPLRLCRIPRRFEYLLLFHLLRLLRSTTVCKGCFDKAVFANKCFQSSVVVDD